MAVPARRLREEPRRRPSGTRRPSTGARRPSARRTSRPRSRRLSFLLFSLVVVMGMVLLLVSAQAMVAQSSFRVTELQERVQKLEQDHDRLRIEAARLSSPERIMRAARQAGLVLPDEVEILAVSGKAARPATSRVGLLAGADLGGTG